MQLTRHLFGTLSLLGAMLLAGCGGGGGAEVRANLQAGQGIAVGEPNGSAVVTADFVAIAQGASCAGTTNRLYLIDNKMVFWERSDMGCADASYGHTLYGATPKTVLCTAADSIAGPMVNCDDAANRSLFDTIRRNLDKADLGLGSAHTVAAIRMPLVAGSVLPFSVVATDSSSAVTKPRQVVVKDAATWASLWAEHSANRNPAPGMPKVDFDKQMLLVLFAGQQANACRALGVQKVSFNGKSIVVDYQDADTVPLALCDPYPGVVAGAPMQAVAIERSDAPVNFVNNTELKFSTLDQSTRSGVQAAQDVVIRDAAAFATLWATHSNGQPAPAVDFGKQMVIGVFLGTSPNGCYSTGIDRIYYSGDTLVVHHNDTVPGMGILCTMNITTPAHLVAIDRSDAKVVFTSDKVAR